MYFLVAFQFGNFKKRLPNEIIGRSEMMNKHSAINSNNQAEGGKTHQHINCQNEQ
jgi:hypothetical protein